MARTLVTGGGGFIGGHMAAALAARGTALRVVDIKPLSEWHQIVADAENVRLDLRDLAACRTAVADVTDCFHLAADMGGMGFIEQNRARCMLSALISTHLLLAARDAGVDRFFFASSACVYAADKQLSPDIAGLKEADAYPAMPEGGYGWQKLFTERMCHYFFEDFGLETRVARYHNIYGPCGSWQGGREKAPAAICRKVIHAKLNGTKTIDIWGDGEQTRSFTYITDCAAGTLKLMASDVREPVNVGSAEKVTINHLVDLVESLAGITLKRVYDHAAPRGVAGRNSDNTKIRALLDWQPEVPLATGLEQTYRWIYDQMVSGAGMPRSIDGR